MFSVLPATYISRTIYWGLCVGTATNKTSRDIFFNCSIYGTKKEVKHFNTQQQSQHTPINNIRCYITTQYIIILWLISKLITVMEGVCVSFSFRLYRSADTLAEKCNEAALLAVIRDASE